MASINYNKYINSTGTHYIANSGGDSKGGIIGDKAGDQNGKEWVLRAWYNRPWSCVLRHPDPQVRRLIAELGIEGALNDLIGYDQGQRTTFWGQLKVSGYRPTNIKTACEQDCSAGSSGCVKAAGYLLGIKKLQDVYAYNNSSTIKADLKKAGFEVLSESKYRTSGKYLLPGDILLYEGHHVAINVTRGAKAEGEVASSVNTGTTNSPASSDSSSAYTLGDRILRNGCEGPDVKEMQLMLIQLGYKCGSYGADGEFGDATEMSVIDFQVDHRPLEVDGEVGPATLAALKAALVDQKVETGYHVRIVGGNCYVRDNPDKTSPHHDRIAREDEMYPYNGQTSPDGWLQIEYKAQPAWVSGKYGRLV